MDDLGSVVIVLITGAVVGLLIGVTIDESKWKAETIDKGLALYCPLDGSWAWVGECSK